MKINAMLFEKTVIMPIMRNVFNVHTVNKYKQTKFTVNIKIVQFSVQTLRQSPRAPECDHQWSGSAAEGPRPPGDAGHRGPPPLPRSGQLSSVR